MQIQRKIQINSSIDQTNKTNKQANKRTKTANKKLVRSMYKNFDIILILVCIMQLLNYIKTTNFKSSQIINKSDNQWHEYQCAHVTIIYLRINHQKKSVPTITFVLYLAMYLYLCYPMFVLSVICFPPKKTKKTKTYIFGTHTKQIKTQENNTFCKKKKNNSNTKTTY